MKNYVFLFASVLLSLNSFASAENSKDLINNICGIKINDPVNDLKKQFGFLKLTDSKRIKNLYSPIDDQLSIFSNQDVDLGFIEIRSLKKSYAVFIKLKTDKFGNRIKVGDSLIKVKNDFEKNQVKLIKKSANELIYEDSQSSSTSQKILIKIVENKVSVVECHQPVD